MEKIAIEKIGENYIINGIQYMPVPDQLDYQILSFESLHELWLLDTDGLYTSERKDTCKSLRKMMALLNNQEVFIVSVKRLSDGLTLSLHDTLPTYKEDITEFSIDSDNDILVHYSKGAILLSELNCEISTAS